MNKKTLWIVIAAVALSVVIVLGIRSSRRDGNGGNGGDLTTDYKVGAIVFLTGPQAPLGSEVRNGLMVAQDELNERGGVNGKKINLLFEDSKDSPRDAILALNRLETEKVPVLIATGDVVSLNLAPVVDEKKTLMIATVAAGPGIPEKSDWVFRVFIQATRQAQTIADYAAQSLKVKSAAILAINNEFGNATTATFKEVFERQGGRITGTDTFGIADRDLRNQITKLKATNPEAIFVTGFGDGYGAAIKQVRELKYQGILLSDNSLSIPFFRQQTTPANEGAYFTSTIYDENSREQATRGFIDRYRSKFNSEPGFIAAFAYDSLRLVANSIQKGGYTSQGIRDALLATKSYPSLVGPLSFSNDGEVEFPLVVKKIEQGQARVVSGGQ